MNSVVDLLLSSEDSDLLVPHVRSPCAPAHVQPLLSLACKTMLNVH